MTNFEKYLKNTLTALVNVKANDINKEKLSLIMEVKEEYKKYKPRKLSFSKVLENHKYDKEFLNIIFSMYDVEELQEIHRKLTKEINKRTIAKINNIV